MMKIRMIGLVLACLMSACTYLKYVSIQAEYERIHNADPKLIHMKHMIELDSYFVLGRIVDEPGRYQEYSLAVTAYSNQFEAHERVDTMYVAGAGTHYGLNLPAGVYEVLVFADLNADRSLENNEVVGRRTIVLNETTAPGKVLSQTDISLKEIRTVTQVGPIAIPEMPELQKSLFYPAGAIRSLDDPLFDEHNAVLGMYDPAAFLGKAPTMFYTLEEDLPYKIPVVFVHGIGGSSRSFKPIIAKLDRNRYKPWFFYYPSGGDLDQLADIFYKVFLSGKVSDHSVMPMILVAHSMGGLVVREALNRMGSSKSENRVELFITIASPLGGHPAAASGEEHGMIVLPAWRDLNPESRFIRELYRKPLPESINYQLLYAYGNPDSLKIGENSDGVVPLSSQLYPQAQQQSDTQFGFNSSHSGILGDDALIDYVIQQIETVPNILPEDHLQIFFKGGYDVELSDDYNPMMVYAIHAFGKYIMALVTGEIDPVFPDQVQFIDAVNGKIPPDNVGEEEWIRFMQEYPELQDIDSAIPDVNQIP